MTGESILVAEDDGLIALSLTDLMEKAGYRVIGAASPGRRCSKCSKNPKNPISSLWTSGLLDHLTGLRLQG